MQTDEQKARDIASLQAVIGELFATAMRSRDRDIQSMHGIYLGAALRLHERCRQLERPANADAVRATRPLPPRMP